jgi:hypothetical protein
MDWTNSDAVKFRDYNKSAGDKVKKFLSALVPKCDGSTIEQVALQAKYKEGYEFALSQIDFLLNFDDKEEDPSSGKFTDM